MVPALLGVEGSAVPVPYLKAPERSRIRLGTQARTRLKVGIFWAAQEPGSAVILMEHRCSLKDAEPYGSMLTCSHGHYDIWEQWRKNSGIRRADAAPLIAVSEYEEWPRGRIAYRAPQKLE